MSIRLMSAELEDAAAVGEEEEAIVGIGDQEASHGVRLAGLHAGDAPAAAPLQSIGVQGHPLDVTTVAEGYHHLLVRDEVLL